MRNHWFCSLSLGLTACSRNEKFLHILLGHLYVCWVTRRPGCGLFLWGLWHSAADRKTATWGLACHPAWCNLVIWVPLRNGILKHEMKKSFPAWEASIGNACHLPLWAELRCQGLIGNSAPSNFPKWCFEKHPSYLWVYVLVCKGCRNKVHRNISSHSPGSQRSKIKVFTGLVSSDTSLLGLQMVIFSLCPHIVFLLCVYLYPNLLFLYGHQSY